MSSWSAGAVCGPAPIAAPSLVRQRLPLTQTAIHLALKLGELTLPISGGGVKQWEENGMAGTGAEETSEIGSGTHMQPSVSCASVSPSS